MSRPLEAFELAEQAQMLEVGNVSLSAIGPKARGENRCSDSSWTRSGRPISPAARRSTSSVAVGDDDRVDARQRDAHAGQTLGQHAQGAAARQPRVDDGHATVILDDVAVRVPEAGMSIGS